MINWHKIERGGSWSNARSLRSLYRYRGGFKDYTLGFRLVIR